jgi:hypothetical protein
MTKQTTTMSSVKTQEKNTSNSYSGTDVKSNNFDSEIIFSFIADPDSKVNMDNYPVHPFANEFKNLQ